MARAQKFKVGDIVQLKSGGPKMTVTDDASVGGFIRCNWFAGAKLNHGSFTPDALLLVSDDGADKKS